MEFEVCHVNARLAASLPDGDAVAASSLLPLSCASSACPAPRRELDSVKCASAMPVYTQLGPVQHSNGLMPGLRDFTVLPPLSPCAQQSMPLESSAELSANVPKSIVEQSLAPEGLCVTVAEQDCPGAGIPVATSIHRLTRGKNKNIVPSESALEVTGDVSTTGRQSTELAVSEMALPPLADGGQGVSTVPSEGSQHPAEGDRRLETNAPAALPLSNHRSLASVPVTQHDWESSCARPHQKHSSADWDTPHLAPSAAAGRVQESSAAAARVQEPSAAAGRVQEPSAAAGRVQEPSAAAGRVQEPSAAAGPVQEPSAAAGRGQESSAALEASDQPSEAKQATGTPTASVCAAAHADASTQTELAAGPAEECPAAVSRRQPLRPIGEALLCGDTLLFRCSTCGEVVGTAELLRSLHRACHRTEPGPPATRSAVLTAEGGAEQPPADERLPDVSGHDDTCAGGESVVLSAGDGDARDGLHDGVSSGTRSSEGPECATAAAVTGLQREKRLLRRLRPASRRAPPPETARNLCTICNKQLSSAAKLQVHRRMHTGERPFVCVYCPKRCADLSNMRKHQQLHFKPRPYQCAGCGITFWSALRQRQHLCRGPGAGQDGGMQGGDMDGSDGPHQSALGLPKGHRQMHTAGTENYDSETENGGLDVREPSGDVGDSVRDGSVSNCSDFQPTNGGPRSAEREDCVSSQTPQHVIHVVEVAGGDSAPVPVSVKKIHTRAMPQPSSTGHPPEAGSAAAAGASGAAISPDPDGERSAAPSMTPRAVSAKLRGAAVPSGPVECQDCGKRLLTSSSWHRHWRAVHSGEKPYHCRYCDKVSNDRGNMRKHEAGHFKPRPFRCDACGITFFSGWRRRMHLCKFAAQEPPAPPTPAPPVLTSGSPAVPAGSALPLARARRAAARSGTAGATLRGKRRDHICHVCGKAMLSYASLEMHYRTHTGERPFQCAQCGKRFSIQGNLVVHQRIHSGERPFQCEECGRTFMYQSHLKIHKRQHSGARPYQCQFCLKGFAASSSRRVHEETVHTDERRFTCETCGTGFKEKKHLKRHRWKKHQDAGDVVQVVVSAQ